MTCCGDQDLNLIGPYYQGPKPSKAPFLRFRLRSTPGRQACGASRRRSLVKGFVESCPSIQPEPLKEFYGPLSDAKRVWR